MSDPKLVYATIDGKTGTVAFFDAAGKMTTPEQATQAKVVFADGSHLWLEKPTP